MNIWSYVSMPCSQCRCHHLGLSPIRIGSRRLWRTSETRGYRRTMESSNQRMDSVTGEHSLHFRPKQVHEMPTSTSSLVFFSHWQNDVATLLQLPLANDSTSLVATMGDNVWIQSSALIYLRTTRLGSRWLHWPIDEVRHFSARLIYDRSFCFSALPGVCVHQSNCFSSWWFSLCSSTMRSFNRSDLCVWWIRRIVSTGIDRMLWREDGRVDHWWRYARGKRRSRTGRYRRSSLLHWYERTFLRSNDRDKNDCLAKQNLQLFPRRIDGISEQNFRLKMSIVGLIASR